MNVQPSFTPKPLYWAGSLLLFGLPALIFFAASHVVYPRLLYLNWSAFDAMILTLTVPLALFVPLTVYCCWRDGYPLTGAAFWARTRFQEFRLRYLGWVLLIVLVSVLLGGLLLPLSAWLVHNGYVTIPAYVPPFLNQVSGSATLGDPNAWAAFVGGPIQGNWRVVVLYALFFFFNIVGEELWWRGYVLPRQISAFGRWAWLIHGGLWALFHLFKWWDVLTILPTCLIIAYVAQRMRSTWPTLIAHAFINVGGLVIAVVMVAK